jgi:hypothetical protein
MKAKLMLVVLAVCGLGFASCDKENDMEPAPSATSTNSTNSGTVGHATADDSNLGGGQSQGHLSQSHQ